MTAVELIIRYEAIIEAMLNGTLQRACAADKRAAPGSTNLRKTSIAASAAAIPPERSVLVDSDEANLLVDQARQRAEHAARKARTSGNVIVNVGMYKNAAADSDTFKASRLRRIVPGFYAGARCR